MRPIYASIILMLFVLSCKNEDKKSKEKKPGDSKEQKAMVVSGIIARDQMTTGSFSTTGTILANEEVEVKSEISGKVTGIYFKEGNPVSKGQLLVKLDDDDIQAQLNKLKIEIKLAQDKENRAKQLLAASAASKEEYESAEGNVNLLKANEQILKTNLAKTRITAPFSGIIGLKNISPGAIISPSNIVATIQNTQPLKLEFSIPEKYNHLLNTGKIVDFTTGGSTIIHKASVYAKEPKIDEVTRTTKVRATFANPGGKLFPGAFAEITISVGEKSMVRMIPSIAYIPDINGAKVFVKKNGVATSVNIKAGLRTEKEIQILEGIEDGDTVITSGILQLKPNTPVEVNIINQAQ